MSQELSRYIELYARRQRIGSEATVTSPTEDGIVPRVVAILSESLNRNLADYKGASLHLKNKKAIIEQETGRAPSRLNLTHRVILEGPGYNLIQEADRAQMTGNVPLFMCLVDMSNALFHIMATIPLAEDALLGRIDEGFFTAVASQEQLGMQNSIADHADEYLRIHRLTEGAIALLRQDRDGFSLIHETAKQIKGEPNRMPHFYEASYPASRPAEVAGADYAVALYDGIYPLTAAI